LSYEITVSFVQAYRDNVVHLAQQKGSRLQGCVRRDPDVTGANYYFERIGATGVAFKTSRHAPTPLISTPHSRRRVTMTTVNWGEAIDNDDKVKLLIQSAYSGADGATAVPFPTGQLIADTSISNDSTLDVGSNDGGHMSPQRLRKIKRAFDLQDVDPDEERFIAVGARQIDDDMLAYTKVTSADYNTIKTLAEGAVDSFMGMKFIMSNFLLLAGGIDVYGNSVPTISGATANDRYDIAWARSGLGLAMNEDVTTFVQRDPGLSYAVRPYAEMALGATRIEEARVVIAAVIETA
jgi:Phage capsid protein